jgi:EmrB/QacA subfamily drug resistance transporter
LSRQSDTGGALARLLPGRRLSTQHAVATVFVAGMFMNIMDSTIVTVALPSIARNFGVDPVTTDGVVVGYLVSLAIWIPASGWVGDRFGTKRTFLFALTVFTAASALCGLARSLPELVAFRILQGVGGGMLTPTGTAMLFRAFPPAERARASRILIVPTVTAPALGPVIGGLVVERLSWPWIFYINLPIGVAAFLFGLAFLVEHREPDAGPFDLAGFALSGAGFAMVLYALAEGPIRGWNSIAVVVTGCAGLAALAVVVPLELRRRSPLLALRLFRNRLFRTNNVIGLFASSAFIGVLFTMPLFLQGPRGLSALTSGLTTFPEALGIMASSQLVGRLYPVVGPRRLMFGGLLGVTAVMAALSRIGLGTDLWTIRALMFLLGVGMAYVFLPFQAATFATITPAQTGRASALFNAQRQLAGALGVAILASVLSAAGAAGAAAATDPGIQVGAYRDAFLVASGLALCGSLVALTVRDSEAANTMVRHGGRGARRPAIGRRADLTGSRSEGSNPPLS